MADKFDKTAVSHRIDGKEDKGNSNFQRLWIYREWYIPVDEEGRCVGQVNEGALGFVVQLKSDRNPDQYMALKLPRLMGETHRENAYIIDLTEKELRSVRKALFTAGGGSQCLLPSLTIDKGPLRSEVTPPDTVEGSPWRGSIVLVCYEKGKNPRFYLAKEVTKHTDNSEQKAIPKGNQEQMGVEVLPESGSCPIKNNTEMFSKIRDNARDLLTQENWVKPVFIESRQDRETQGGIHDGHFWVLSMDHAVKDNPVGTTWHASLPSIVYHWADGTLQESISRGEMGTRWKISHHLLLTERVCHALAALHSRQMLHADVRPANIVYTGEPTEPSNYFLTDYGSFAEAGPQTPDQGHTGLTVLGPIVGGERTSPFYGPERRAGRERETANTAVIIQTGGETLYVVLGWKSDLIDGETGRPRPTIETYRNQRLTIPTRTSAALGSSSTYSHLRMGDRIQVRDYIFELVKDEWFIDNIRVLECKKDFWKIYHGRIVVQNEDRFEEIESFPFPRAIELLQWSAATDLYSLGALALYSVYYEAQRRKQQLASTSVEQRKEKQESHMSSSKIFDQNIKELQDTQTNLNAEQSIKHPKDSGDNSNTYEENFRAMLEYLASPPYFHTIWPELMWLVWQLQELLKRSDLTPENFPNVEIFNPFDKRPGGPNDTDPTSDTKKPLRHAVAKGVGQITQTAPQVYDLLIAFDYNLGHFVFFIHFVLCCLHRRDEMKSSDHPKYTKEENLKELLPFCEDRCERPRKNGATDQALRRLIELREKVVNIPLLSQLTERKEAPIPAFDPRTDSQIRIELDKLVIEQAELNKRYNELSERRNQLEQCLNSLDGAFGQGLKIAKEIVPDECPQTLFERIALLLAKRKATTSVRRIKQVLESSYKNLPVRSAANDQQEE